MPSIPHQLRWLALRGGFTPGSKFSYWDAQEEKSRKLKPDPEFQVFRVSLFSVATAHQFQLANRPRVSP